ncbi:MAG TPA: Asp-tRNA(Asn)/Glu-tRNA(Gln) amidotransferase subunit GatB [Candidatus Saccharimonadales bacterium]|nr:Asp-tRNA(Asn)/Glu-tRNA(Gln) amidotransferase subunit GatB [Candidatus Saccharimonadales bacterium]
MISSKIRSKYKATIGIECHVQLKTKTKLFSAVGNDAREAPPNTLVSHIDFGLPGALPVLNQEVLHLATRAAFALGTKPEKFSKFDRKHYFYPDLPKGYQISQFDQPIIAGGKVTIDLDSKTKNIGITRAHLEEDAGKSTHLVGQDFSLVDLNRAGTPLLEIVSEPDISSSAEAKAYARELYLLMRYADVSDADLYYGNMRFDVNVSVSPNNKLGTRTETKNLNSFRSVEKAVDYEIYRQIEVIEKGQRIIQETRGWNDAKQKTFSQRSKENADDYRYMPDPDLPPVVLSNDFVNKISKEMPVMPGEWRQRLEKLGLDKSHVETLLEAEIEDSQTSYLPLIEMYIDNPEESKFLANVFVNLEIPMRRDKQTLRGLKDAERAEIYSLVYKLVSNNKLNSTNAKILLTKLLTADVLPNNIEDYAKQQGLIQVSDEAAISKIVKQVIDDNPKAAADIKKGETKVIGFLVGQVMKASKGQANPEITKKLIHRQLGL